MVSRKTSLPFPTSPPPPVPTIEPWPSRHDIDAINVPPIPVSLSRPAASTYRDEGNPWAEIERHNWSPTRAAGGSNGDFNRAGQTNTSAADNVPDVLKAGWSGQNTPRSSIDSQGSRDFWEDSEDEVEADHTAVKQNKPSAGLNSQQPDGMSQSDLPIRRKPVASPSEQAPQLFSPREFQSTNPFRRGSSAGRFGADEASTWTSTDKGKGKEVVGNGVPVNTHSNDKFTGSAVPDLSAYKNSSIYDAQADWTSQQQTTSHPLAPPPPMAAPPPPPVHEPPPIPEISSPFGSQPPLIPVSPKPEAELKPWSGHPKLGNQGSPNVFSAQPKLATEKDSYVLNRGDHEGLRSGPVFLGADSQTLPELPSNSAASPSLLDGLEQVPGLPERKYKQHDTETYLPPPGPPPSHLNKGISAQSLDLLSDEIPPAKPPRPAIVTRMPSEQEIAQMHAQRSETYHVKHFNWFDQKSGRTRSSSMLLQNKNGPCPLLALVNALILGATEHEQALLDGFLRAREQVTLGTIIENLIMELLSRSADGVLPDVDELNRFLLKLTTGMNMNPRFVRLTVVPNLMDARNSMLHLPTQQGPKNQVGTFEASQDMALYGSFGIETVHGWLPEPNSDAAEAFLRSAPTYEDAQAKLFGEDELEYKVSNDGLNQQEQIIWQDIVSMKTFLNTYRSQLTPYGLQCIQSHLLPGDFAILFRNDHFSTIYRRPQDGRLYSLVTDAGFADKEEIWQSLVDTTGHDSDFFSGEFKKVVHQAPPLQHERGTSGPPADMAPPMSPQEQSDADFAMALQLQLEEEEEEQRRRRAQSQSNGSSSRPSGGRRSNNNSTSSLLRQNNSSQETRPLMPPRNARSNIQAVNRPSDTADADAPPAYEEAARGKPYNPPIGSPLHPQSSPTPDASPYNSTSQLNLNPNSAPGPSSSGRPNNTGRRQSAYTENARYGRCTSSGRYEMGMSPAYDFTDQTPGSGFGPGRRMPGAYNSYSYNSGPSIASGTNGNVQVPRLTRQNGDRDRDCIVM